MPWLTTRRLLIAAIGVWCVIAVIGLVIGPPLGHDEAAFAVAARGDAPAGGWLYRSEGTIALGWIGVALGGAEWQMRLASAVLGAGIVVAAFGVGRVAFSARTGAWAAAVVAGAHPMTLRSAQLLSDLPAAAAVLGGVAVVIAELERGVRWRIVAAAPLFAAGFYLRYGSAPIVVLGIGVAAAVWWRAVMARPLPVVTMVAVLAGLLVPHLVQSAETTGSMLGVLEVSAGMPRRAYVGEGLVTYLTSNPFGFYGALVAPVMVAGVVALVRARRRAAWCVGLVAVGQVVLLGLQSHGQPRYVYVATVLLVVLGVDAIRRLAEARRGSSRIAVATVVVAAAWIGALVAQVVACRNGEPARAPIVAAAGAIRGDAAGRPCAVAAMLAPQLIWYSGCAVFPVELGRWLPADRVRYAVSFTRWPIEIGQVTAAQQLRATEIASGDAAARVWRLE